MSNDTIVMYGTRWCGDCFMARRTLDRVGVTYEYIDISNDEEAQEFVQKVNRGQRSVPTIVFPDGDILVEPSPAALLKKVNAQPR